MKSAFLSLLLPAWLRAYPRACWPADLSAGLMVAILVIPQSLAYALLAGLPPQYGLYVSIFPVLAYAWFGSSRVQAVGPVAITAIMTYAVLAPLAVPGSAAYLALAAALSLLSGALVLACGLLRLGFLSQLLSRPVASGFISGSAVLIVLSQCKHLLGVPVAGHGVVEQLPALVGALPATNPVTLAIGGGSLLLLALARRYLGGGLRRLGMRGAHADFVVRLQPLLLLLLATLAVSYGELDRRFAVAVIGQIVAGLPPLDWSPPDWGILRLLFVPACTMTLVGMVQNLSMAQALAVKRGERIDANAELRGLGIANLVAGVYGGMPVGGGVSRSAVNVAAGAQTQLASIVTALSTILLVLWAAPWLARLPLAVLAASIVLAAWSMIDLAALRQAWAYDRADACAWLGTACGVIFLGVDVGIGLGVLLSLATLLFHASQPHIAVIGRLPGSEHFRNVDRHRVETLPGVLFLRIDESLFFGNLAAIETRIRQQLAAQPGCRELVLVMSAVNRMDATAVEALAEFDRDLGRSGVRLHLAEVKGPVQDRLQGTALWQELSGEVFLSASAAFDSLATDPAANPG